MYVAEISFTISPSNNPFRCMPRNVSRASQPPLQIGIYSRVRPTSQRSFVSHPAIQLLCVQATHKKPIAQCVPPRCSMYHPPIFVEKRYHSLVVTGEELNSANRAIRTNHQATVGSTHLFKKIHLAHSACMTLYSSFTSSSSKISSSLSTTAQARTPYGSIGRVFNRSYKVAPPGRHE